MKKNKFSNKKRKQAIFFSVRDFSRCYFVFRSFLYCAIVVFFRLFISRIVRFIKDSNRTRMKKKEKWNQWFTSFAALSPCNEEPAHGQWLFGHQCWLFCRLPNSIRKGFYWNRYLEKKEKNHKEINPMTQKRGERDQNWVYSLIVVFVICF